MITAGPRNRIGPEGPRGLRGLPGEPGPEGIPGSSPDYQWRGQEIRFKKPDGSWGKWVNLKGEDGKRGPTGLGMAGPAGPPYELEEVDADPSVSAGDFVRVTGPNLVNKITENSIAQMPQGVFALAAVMPTPTLAKLQVFGLTSIFSGLTTGAAYFISTTGTLTAVPPSTGMVQQVGIALSPTKLLINFMQPMRRS